MRSSLRRAAAATGTRRHVDHLVILLPDPRILRLVSRSVLLFAALVSFPWIRSLPQFRNGGALLSLPPPNGSSFPRWVDNPFLLPMLIADLKREGLFSSQCRALFVGNPSSRVGFLRRNRVEVVSEYPKLKLIEDGSVDFVLAADGMTDLALRYVDRVLKVGGILTVRLGAKSPLFHLPGNYRVAYIRRFGATVVAVKKISDCDFASRLMGRRRLLLVNELKAKLCDRRSVVNLNENADNLSLEIEGEVDDIVRNVKIGSVGLVDEMKQAGLRGKSSVYANVESLSSVIGREVDVNVRSVKIGMAGFVEEVKAKLWDGRSVYLNLNEARNEKVNKEARNAKIGVVSLVDGVFGQSMKVREI